MTFTCGTCWREFPAGWRSRQQHMDALGHEEPPFECDSCDSFFGSERAKEQHMDALNHWGQSYHDHECDDCSDTFSDEEDLRDHEMEVHFYCNPCDRYFQNYNNLKMHRNSKVHRPAGLSCPFCSKTATSATGLAHHLERGACPNAPLDRTTLHEAVRRRDPNGILTKKLLEGPGGATANYEATSMAWNSDRGVFECYFCHAVFGKLASLNQHLASPVHQQELYHCPNGSCGRGFTTLAGVMNHLESESCQFMRFNDVQRTAERILDPGRMIKF